ncbi:hypothetical protein ACLOJK_019816 [Asimina triloba]
MLPVFFSAGEEPISSREKSNAYNLRSIALLLAEIKFGHLHQIRQRGRTRSGHLLRRQLENPLPMSSSSNSTIEMVVRSLSSMAGPSRAGSAIKPIAATISYRVGEPPFPAPANPLDPVDNPTEPLSMLNPGAPSWSENPCQIWRAKITADTNTIVARLAPTVVERPAPLSQIQPSISKGPPLQPPTIDTNDLKSILIIFNFNYNLQFQEHGAMTVQPSIAAP